MARLTEPPARRRALEHIVSACSCILCHHLCNPPRPPASTAPHQLCWSLWSAQRGFGIGQCLSKTGPETHYLPRGTDGTGVMGGALLLQGQPPVKAGFRDCSSLAPTSLAGQMELPCSSAVSACITDPPKTAQRPEEHQELALICSKHFMFKYFMTIQLLRAGRVQDYSPEAWTAYYLSGTRRHSRHQFYRRNCKPMLIKYATSESHEVCLISFQIRQHIG